MNITDTPFVVTRPAPDHRGLTQRLGEAGVPVIHSPAFAIEPVPELHLGERLDSLTSFDIVIVTSPVAARLIAERELGPGKQGRRFVAPGPGTASVLHAAGLQCKFPENGGTSEHVLAMPELANVGGTRLAVVNAPGGRGLLARELSRRGAIVETVSIYARKPLAPAPELISALRQGREPVVLISSRQAFDMITDALCEQLRPAWLSLRYIVSSRRLEKVCRAAGVSRIRRAGGAADARMLAAAAAAGWMRR